MKRDSSLSDSKNVGLLAFEVIPQTNVPLDEPCENAISCSVVCKNVLTT